MICEKNHFFNFGSNLYTNNAPKIIITQNKAAVIIAKANKIKFTTRITKITIPIILRTVCFTLVS